MKHCGLFDINLSRLKFSIVSTSVGLGLCSCSLKGVHILGIGVGNAVVSVERLRDWSGCIPWERAPMLP